MRVLFAYRSDVDVDGGAGTVMRETASALAALGVEVEVTYDLRPDVEGYDLVHAFNIWHPATALEQLRHFRESGVPVVWLPFYLHWCETAWAIRAVRRACAPALGREERAELLRGLREGTVAFDGFERFRPNEIEPGFHADLAEMLGCVDHICAISRREMQTLFQTAGVAGKPFTVTPHGVDPIFRDASPEPFRELYGADDFVLCVGALDGRKNQLMLAEALRGTGLRLVLIGPCFEPDYLQLCLERGGGDVVHIERLPRSLVASAYKAAAVHALPSFAEGAALASLEAALAGTALVVSNRSSEFEYFGDLPYYCDPADPASIRGAVLAAWEEREDHARWRRLSDRVGELTWQRTAEATLDAYHRTLAARSERQAQPEAERFVTLARADELIANPELLRAYGATFSRRDAATLVIDASGWTDLALGEAFEPLLIATGLDTPDAPDMLALTGEPDAASDNLATNVHAVLSRRPLAPSLRGTPRFDDETIVELRRLADRLQAAPAADIAA